MEEWISSQCLSIGVERERFVAVSLITSSQKAKCLGFTVERVLSETAGETILLVRDDAIALPCCVHTSVVSQYPMILDQGTVVILRQSTCVATPRSATGLTGVVILCCLDNVAGIFARERVSEGTDAGQSLMQPRMASSTAHHNQFMETLEFGDDHD